MLSCWCDVKYETLPPVRPESQTGLSFPVLHLRGDKCDFCCVLTLYVALGYKGGFIWSVVHWLCKHFRNKKETWIECSPKNYNSVKKVSKFEHKKKNLENKDVLEPKRRQTHFVTACKLSSCLQLGVWGVCSDWRCYLYTFAPSRRSCHEEECFGVILRNKQFPFVIDGKKHVNHTLLSKKPDPATSTFLLNVCNRDFCKGGVPAARSCTMHFIYIYINIYCIYI